MLNLIKTTALAATVSTFALASFATAVETPPVAEVSVEVSALAAQDSNAARVYETITTDLAHAISDRVTLGTGEDSYDIRVDIRKVALDGDTLAPNGDAFNQLEGVVVLNGPNTGSGNETFPVRISAMTGEQVVPAGFIGVRPGTDDFYDAMIVSFAENVAEQLSGVYTGG